MIDILKNKEFDFISKCHKDFIISFDQAMDNLGYHCGNDIGPGYVWGKYMIIYCKKNVKSKKVYARIYIKEDSIILRMYFNNIDKHKTYIESLPNYLKEVFIGDNGNCTHCHNEKNGQCKFRKTYTIHNKYIEKCNGIVFEFLEPDTQRITDYINLFKEFYPSKRTRMQ